MKKTVILLVAIASLILILAGCEKSETPLNDFKPMLMVDGKLYLDTGKVEEGVASITAFDKEILSTVKQSEKPTEDGQSNFGCVGNSYAVDDEGVIVIIDDEWVRFKAE